jgi:hypothetical protein
VRIVRAKRLIGVLVVLLAVSVLPALAVRAMHSPSSGDVVKEAQALLMVCSSIPGQQVCSGSDPISQSPRSAYITPETGPLIEVQTVVNAVSSRIAAVWSMTDADKAFNSAVHNVGCAAPTDVDSFVKAVAALAVDGSVPKQVVGECSMAGSLGFVGDFEVYTITSTLLPSASSPTPSPTPKSTATPTATPKPTSTPKPTTTPTRTPQPTVTATASATESASPSATATDTASPTQTPEQTVAGIVFTPAPSQALPAQAGGSNDWAGSVPSAGDVSSDPKTLAGSAVAALLLLLAMGFIGELFNNTLESNYDRILAGWRKSWLGRIGKAFSGLWGGGA